MKGSKFDSLLVFKVALAAKNPNGRYSKKCNTSFSGSKTSIKPVPGISTVGNEDR